MRFQTESSRNPHGIRASRAHAHRAVPYPHPLLKTYNPLKAVVGPYTWAEALTTSACGHVRASRQRSMTAFRETGYPLR
jgi:hypothetical protein